jgi:hypothetical protein
MSRLVIYEAEQRTDAQGRGVVGRGGLRFERLGSQLAAHELAELRLELAAAEVHGRVVRRRALDEHKVGLGELATAGCQRPDAVLVAVAGRHESTVVEAEHGPSVTAGDLQIASVAQLADELHEGGQANTAERTLELNHLFDVAEALVRNA